MHSQNKSMKFETPYAFLAWAWKRRSQGAEKLGLRTWARAIGFKTHTPLSLMLAGKRPIPKKYLPKMGRVLNLSPKEILYLDLLIDYHGSEGAELKEMYKDRIQMIWGEGQSVPMREFENYRYLSDPIHTLLLEMSVLKGFQFDAHWIQRKLLPDYKVEEIAAALERLLELDIAKIDELGRLKKTQANLTCRPDVKSEGVQNYHCAVMDWAKEAVRTQDVLEREFAGYSLNIKKNKMPLAKKMIRKFIADFIQEIEAPEYKGEESCQLNLQFFKLTKDSL